MPSPPAPAQAAATSVDVDTIWRQFMTDFATGDRYWWWPRSVRVDPDEIIADDDEGHLWRVGFSTDGETEVTFDEPVQVRESFVPVATSATTGQPQQILQTYTSAPERPVATEPAASRPNTTTEVTTMSDTIALPRDTALQVLRSQGRDVLDDASDEQIATMFNEAPPEPVEPEPEPVTPEPEPVATSTVTEEDGIVKVSKQVWDDREARLEKLETDAAAREQVATTARRDDKVRWAVTTGRITPAERDHYRGMADIDEAKTFGLLEGLTASRVPVTEVGVTPSSDTDNFDGGTGLFPEFATQEA